MVNMVKPVTKEVSSMEFTTSTRTRKKAWILQVPILAVSHKI